MKSHFLNKLFAVCICGSMAAVGAETLSGEITVTHNTETEIAYGITTNQDGNGVTKITNNITDGAIITAIAGGIEIKSTQVDQYKKTEGTTIKDGVVINMTGGTVTNIKGGNCLNVSSLNDPKAIAESLGGGVNVGSIEINVSGGELGKAGSSEEAIMGGGGRHCGTADDGGITINISGNAVVNNLIYAGTNAGSTGYTELNISGGTINSSVYGGGRKPTGVVLGDTNVNISGGTITGNVYAAGDADTIKGNANVTITGGTIGGIVSGGGTSGSTVDGKSTLTIGSDEQAYNGSIKVASFENISISAGSEVTIESFEIAAAGTTITVADEATLSLSLNEVAVSSDNSGIIFEGDGDITLNTDNLNFTVVLTEENLAQGGTQTFTLIEGNNSLVSNISSSNPTIKFVLEDGTEYSVASYGLELDIIEDTTLSGPIVIGPDGSLTWPSDSTGKSRLSVNVTIPEPATTTLSLLALAALANRRRRK